MKYLIVLFITFNFCGKSTNDKAIQPETDFSIITDTVYKLKFIKSIDDIDIFKLKSVKEDNIYLKKIRKFSSSAQVYEIEKLAISNKFISKIYIIWQEARYTSLNIVTSTLDGTKIIDETELMIMGGDGDEAYSSNYSFIDDTTLLYTKYYIEYDANADPNVIKKENVMKKINPDGKITEIIL